MTEKQTKAQMQLLHQKWRETVPDYPAHVTKSKRCPFTGDCVCHVDMTVHANAYYFVLAIEPLFASCIRVRWDARGGDNLDIILGSVVAERRIRFSSFLALAEKHVPDTADRQRLLQTINVLEACMVLARAYDHIRTNYPYAFAPDDAIDECFVRYIVAHGYAEVNAFATHFYKETANASWIVPTPNFEDSDE